MNSFKKFVGEMTLSYGQAFYNMPDFSEADHIGDIEHNKILHKTISGVEYYAITVGETPVCFIQTQPLEILGSNYLYVRNVYTEKEYQSQTLAKKLLFFLRNVEKKSIILGEEQSRAGQDFCKSIARTKRFPMFWLNTTTGEKKDYNPEQDTFSLKPYRSLSEPTGWVVMIEGCGRDWMDRFLAESYEQGPSFWERGIIWFE